MEDSCNETIQHVGYIVRINGTHVHIVFITNTVTRIWALRLTLHCSLHPLATGNSSISESHFTQQNYAGTITRGSDCLPLTWPQSNAAWKQSNSYVVFNTGIRCAIINY